MELNKKIKLKSVAILSSVKESKIHIKPKLISVLILPNKEEVKNGTRRQIKTS